MNDNKLRFCIFGSMESFYEDFEEINEDLKSANAEFVKRPLGGGTPIENILSIFLEISKSFALSYAYAKFEKFILKCLHKHNLISDERNANPVVEINYRKTEDGEYTKIRLENCSDEMMIETLNKVFGRSDGE